MKLTFDQMKACTKGAVTIRENADGTVQLRRMTDEQIALYPIHDPTREFSCCCTAGIQLDFYTDSDTLTVTTVGHRKKKFDEVNMDVLENGVLTQGISNYVPHENSTEVVPVPRKNFRFTLTEGEKRVTLYLPRAFCVDGITVELCDGATFRPYTHAKTMIAFGDSITFGASASRPSRSYVNRLSRMLDAEVYNYGIGGERFEEWKIAGDYPACDFVTVAYGTNDFGHKTCNNEMFSYKMPAFIKAVSEKFLGVPVFILLPLWRADEDMPHNDIGVLQNVRDRIAQEAAKYPNMTVIDCQTFIPHEPKMFADLKLHPNDDGMEYYAMGVYEAIKDKI